MSQPMENTPKEISARMRKEVRYSALTTMSMRLLKTHHIYESSQQTAKMMQIKSQKNFSIIALRVSLLHRYLIENKAYCKESAATFICNYLRENLKDVLECKFCKPSQNNSPQFLQIAL